MNKIFSISKLALPPTFKSVSWLLKLMIPISLAVALLQYFGVIQWIASYLNPFFSYLGLPGSSALIFITGAAAGTYAGIAAMMSIQLTLRQASIMALMICLCHALPMECAVNRKTGSSFWGMGLLRILMAFVCAIVLNLILPEMDGQYIYMGAGEECSLIQVLITWLFSQLKMSCIVFLIIYILMLIQKIIEERQWLQPLSQMLAPLMRLFGLPVRCAYMWLVGNVLGVSYGSAVMLELKEKGLITTEEANDVNYHLIMNHSMLEDTIVFAMTGISAFLVIGTRLFFAILLVWMRHLVHLIKG